MEGQFLGRLRDGDHAYKLLCDLLVLVGNSGTDLRGGGTYANFFVARPPFQIDGNFGAPNGINEMLLQSHEAYADPAAPTADHYVLDLLPALPAAWLTGRIAGTDARVRYAGRVIPFTLKPGQSTVLTRDKF